MLKHKNRKAKWWQPLRVLDEFSASLLRRLKRKLDRLDERVAQTSSRGKEKLDRLDCIVMDGASKGLTKKRTGYPWLDRLSAYLYEFCHWFDWLDTWIFFRDRPYQAKACRVRSKSEKQIANWLTNRGIRFKYEKRLRFGRVKVHPDFFLTNQNVYVEFWGLANTDPDYNKTRQAKLRLYRQYGIQVISLYPRHLKSLDSVFPKLFLEATSRELP